MLRRLTRDQIASLVAQTDRAYHVALRATGIPAIAEDAVQEAFASLLQRPPQDLGEDRHIGYFLCAVRGIALDMQRGSRRQRARDEVHAMANPQQAPGADEACAKNEVAHAARVALTDLPQDEREAVGLCCEMDLTQRQASEILGIPESTLCGRLNRGIEKLRLQLTAQGFAALAPAGIVGALGELGAVKAPAGLSASLSTLGAGAAKAGVYSGAKIAAKSIAVKKAAAGAGIGSKLILATVVAATASGAYVAMHSTPKAPVVQPLPAPQPATPSPAPKAVPFVERSTWQDTFSDLGPWGITEWRRPGGLAFEKRSDAARSAPAALGLKYTYPRLKAESKDADEWVANHRTIERQVRLPKDATHIRFWIKVLSAEPEASFVLSAYPADRQSSWGINCVLSTLGNDWVLIKEPLARMPQYWRNGVEKQPPGPPPPMKSDEIVFLELGCNHNNSELVVDDLEFIQEAQTTVTPQP